MAKQVPNEFLDLFSKPAFGNVATLAANGFPQVTPVWVDYDGQYILINTAQGRRKEQNMRERSKVGVDILDPQNPYRYISVQGDVAEITTAGADEHIDKLAKRYMGVDTYPFRTPTETRVICKILPEHVITQNV